MVWCRSVLPWTAMDNWLHICFSDESKFNLTFNDGRVRVWRSPGEEYQPENQGLVTRNTVSIMVWGVVTFHGVGELVLVDGNMNGEQYVQILDENLLQSVENNYGDRDYSFFFQDDNAPAHRARVTNEWIDNNGIRHIQWPAQSPDINIIENLWDEIGKGVTKDRPATRNELIHSVYQAWGKITPDYIQNLYRSLPRHVRPVVRAAGFATKYRHFCL